MKKIAITGGIGSGKSSVATYIASLGYPVFSCDEIYKNCIVSPEYIAKIQTEFPSAVINGQIDRKKLSECVFGNETARLRLNNIAHPLIMQELYRKMEKELSAFVFAEVPLLFEGGYEKDFDVIIIVERNKDARIDSILRRDGLTKTEAEERIQAQNKLSNWIKEQISHKNVFRIENNEDLATLQQKTRAILCLIQNTM